MPRSVVTVASSFGECVHVSDIGYGAKTDEQILRWAKENKRVIITRDFDFANILLVPKGKHCGIVVLKIPTDYRTENINHLLASFLSEVDTRKLTKAVIIVEEGRYRIR